MSSAQIEVSPVVSYPREAMIGKTYLMTVDLSHAVAAADWPYEDEEFELYCILDTAGLFRYDHVGEPVVVLHRFGGTYGPASFLLTATGEEREGGIQVTLVNASGASVRTLSLAPIRIVREQRRAPQAAGVRRKRQEETLRLRDFGDSAPPLSETPWLSLLHSIRERRCLPVIGPGAAAGFLPLGSELARRWATEYDYPMENNTDLAEVAQYIAVLSGGQVPRYRLVDTYRRVSLESFDTARLDQPHRAMARLALPMYLTTAYDDLLEQALIAEGRQPSVEICQWHMTRQNRRPSRKRRYADDWTSQRPLVFHLYGSYHDPESLVLTSDDYLDFIIAVSRERNIVPLQVQEALVSSAVLYVGFNVLDWSFRVILQAITATETPLRASGIATMVAPLVEAGTPEEREIFHKQVRYLTQYFERQRIAIYWGTAQQFAAELVSRWQSFGGRIES